MLQLSNLKIGDFIQPGARFAEKYIVERELGRGGMGSVLLVQHPELGTRVALKVMLPELAADERLVERFLREGKATARLTSEHVARVFDAGRHPAGFPYLVMEFLSGRTLDDLVGKEGPLAIPTAVDLLLQACEGVAHAHAAGIVHRDLKPANLFLVPRADGSVCLKVLDFGIAKEIGGASPMTGTAESFGSPEYMSPEQIRAAKDVDPRSDVWSLGVVLFEVLTCRVPFESPSVFEVASKILGEPAQSLEDLRPDAPPGLADVLARCFEKNPARRYPSVAELAAALAPFGGRDAPEAAERISVTLGVGASPLFGMPGATRVTARASSPIGDATTELSWPRAAGSSGFTSRRRLARVAIALLALSAIAAAFSAWAFHASRRPPEVLPVPSAALAPSAATTPSPSAPALLATPGASAAPTPPAVPSVRPPPTTPPSSVKPPRATASAPAVAPSSAAPAVTPSAAPTGMSRHGE